MVAGGLSVMVMNWVCVIASFRNKRSGIDKYHSPVLLVPEILIGVAALLPLPFPKWILLIPLVFHIGTWMLPIALFCFFRQIIFSGKEN